MARERWVPKSKSSEPEDESVRAAEESEFARLVASAADAIISIDGAQAITVFNAGAERLFGHLAREVMGQPLDVLLPERFRNKHLWFLEHFARSKAVARKMGARQRILALRKNGEEFIADAAISQAEFQGKVSMTVILRDMTEQRRQEAEQRFLVMAGEMLSSTSLDYERTLSRVSQLAVQSLADWCLVYLREGGGVHLSEVAHRIPEKQPLAASLWGFDLDLGKPFLAREVMVQRKPLLLARVSARHLESVAQSPEHLQLLQWLRPRSFMGVPLLANNEVLGALVFIASESHRTYTRRHLELAEQLGRLSSLALENARLYQVARRASQAREEVLGVVAHDLRSPLHTIMLSSEPLAGRWDFRRAPEGEPPGEEVSQRLETITQAARRMDVLIGDLLDVSRLDAGQCLAIQVSALPASPLLRDAMEQARLQARNVRLSLDEGEELPGVLMDRHRMLQVFSNLMGNALKFTPAGGEVRVGGRVKDGQVEFYVADTGPGIAAEAREHLFERFWQAQPGAHRGVGLGLSIVKGIIDAHGGQVRVESEPGHGSTFFFSVPVAG